MSIGIFNGLAKNLARGEARDLARQFGGQGGSESTYKTKFNHMWELTWRAKTYADEHHDAMQADVDANLDRLGGIVAEADRSPTGATARRNAPNGLPHLTSYRTAPVSGRYVVFSDIHITQDGNRQDFFSQRNKALYLDVLTRYYGPEGWTLIENGDVEELLIFEPDPSGMPDFKDDSWSRIFEDREERKFAQFQEILHDHADYYRVVHDNFIARNRYFRTIGNHDTDLSSATYADEVTATLGIAWPRASDMVLLTGDDNVDTIICHGHQFDLYCVAAHAKYAGESFSQGGAWAYQGPDRHWTLEMDGTLFINKWLDGSKPFLNMLVSDDPGNESTLDAQLGAIALKGINELHDPDKWEALYGKNVAWEYFSNDDPMDAFNEEVKTGIRWYKYRHMDELRIVDRLEAQFGTSGVRLLLGHSHEPRINAGKRSTLGQPVPRAATYLNSAAAGRFENLVWGIEIDDGVARVISWNRDFATGDVVRTVWEEGEVPGFRYLTAGAKTTVAAPEPAPEPEQAETPDMTPIFHMMFS